MREHDLETDSPVGSRAASDSRHNDGRFDKPCLVASPEFPGMLRKLLAPEPHGALALEIDKDYTQSSPQQLREHLREHRRNA